MTAEPTISVVIPLYNERAGLEALLGNLRPFNGRCELIFVDGGSGDGTVAALEAAGVRALASAKGRANQMNLGAARSAGEILWFLHADSVPPANALEEIRRVIGRGRRLGCFPLRFDSRHPLAAFNALLSNLRVIFRRIAFGDQGIFLERSLFDELGGFAPIPIMEDYRLSLDARKHGLRIGMARGFITTSARRYKAGGILRTMLRMQALQHRFRRGDSIEEIAAAYRRMDH